jgi:hypothetical protein
LGAENRPEIGQTSLQKGHSCDATVALLSGETTQMENQGDLNAPSEAPTQCFNTIFSTYPEHFHRRVFVNKITCLKGDAIVIASNIGCHDTPLAFV